MSDEPPKLPTTVTPAKSKSWFTFNKAMIGLFLLLVLKAVVDPYESTQPTKSTLQEWGKQAITVTPETYLKLGQLYVEAPALIAAVGEPDEIKPSGTKVLLRWKCKDGRVEALVDRHTYELGDYLVGTISFYRE